jgi:spore germination cell wall hydrolase CwlJ-like protein
MKELDCLARNIYFESAGEPFEGKVAVAQVTLNRVASGKFADSVCGVVYQKNVFYEKVVCQFSWYCDRPATLKIRSPELYDESMKVAKKVLLENFRLEGLHNAMYYHADYVNPGWRKVKITKIGHHIFYQG